MSAEITLWVGAAAVMTALVMLGTALLSASDSRAGGAAATDLRQVVLRQRARKRLLGPVLTRVSDAIHTLTPSGALQRLDHKIDVAGARATWSVDRLLGTKVLLASLGGTYGIYRVLNEPTVTNVFVTFLLTAGGFGIPDFILSRRANERQTQIDMELPDLLDQMVVSVEAGLGFEAAMSRVAKQNEGALPHELARVLQDVRFGMSRRDAFAKLLKRTDSSDLKQFVNALTQAERLGMPLADVLRVQADEMRKKRRMRAEETALKIPVKLVFPLLLCILPALFVVIIGPAIIRVSESGL
ncbi:MAG: type II secretion system F family protein [Acidimicrobiales bacterium]